jgi:hypothetical protein
MGDAPSLAQQQADAFVQANMRSAVVVGRDMRAASIGATYKLADGSRHTISGEAFRLLPEGYPQWRNNGEGE